MTYQRIVYWVAGWLTAYNMMTPETYVLAYPDAVMVWAGNWCRQNPTKKMSSAMEAFATEQYASRTKKAPR